MKKFIVFCLLFFSTIKLFSEGISFGVFAEPLISWMKPNVASIQYNGVRAGFNLGLIADYYFTENYAVATGIGLNSCGGRLFYDNITPIYTSNGRKVINNQEMIFSLQYVEIPVGIKMKTNMIGRIAIFANVGLVPQINVKANAKASDFGFVDIRKDEIYLFNFGYNFGGGIEYSIGGNSSIVAGLLFKNGFTDITKTPSNDLRIIDKTTLSSLSIKIGIIF
jgi:hypothetical protein